MCSLLMPNRGPTRIIDKEKERRRKSGSPPSHFVATTTRRSSTPLPSPFGGDRRTRPTWLAAVTASSAQVDPAADVRRHDDGDADTERAQSAIIRGSGLTSTHQQHSLRQHPADHYQQPPPPPPPPTCPTVVHYRRQPSAVAAR